MRGRNAELVQHDAALGDVLGVVADALQFAGDLQRRDDLAQVLRHRLAQRQQADDELLGLALQRVHLRVSFHGLAGGLGVAFQHRRAGQRDLALDHAAHIGDQVRAAGPGLCSKLLTMCSGVSGHPIPSVALSRTGR